MPIDTRRQNLSYCGFYGKTMSIEFFITSMVVILIPGTGVIYTLTIGLGKGFWPAVAAAFGCMLGIIPAAIASIIGLAAIFHSSAVAFQLIKYLGVLYLFYMAWSIIRDDSSLTLAQNKKPVSMSRIIINGAMLNVLNPKLSLFFLAFLPQFIDPESQSTSAMLVMLAAIFMGLTFVVFVIYGAFASLARNYVISRPSVMVWMKRIFAASFGLLGLRLVLAER